MKINVERSIKGLWIATGNEGYLESWFPRLRTSTGRLIPLSPGVNVFYGRNGAGKTQMLEAIAYAAEYKMSAYEGFVLHNPTVAVLPAHTPRNVTPDSPGISRRTNGLLR